VRGEREVLFRLTSHPSRLTDTFRFAAPSKENLVQAINAVREASLPTTSVSKVIQ
jgi:hypothetical protein